MTKIQKHYKYRPINENTEKIFTGNEIYFSSPSSFNDPFDGQIGFAPPRTHPEKIEYFASVLIRQRYATSKIKARKLARSKYRAQLASDSHWREMTQAPVRTFSQMGVYCLSELNDNILMYSHYAGNHTGVCLEFEARVGEPLFAAAQKVMYSTEYPTITMATESEFDRTWTLLLTKANGWSYEKEWRIALVPVDVDFPPDADPIVHELPKGPGTHSFPPAALTGVIFGCRAKEKDKDRYRSILRERKIPLVIHEARKKEREFGLEILEIESI